MFRWPPYQHPEVETFFPRAIQATMYTPDRSLDGALFGGDSTDMIICHTEALEVDQNYDIGGRTMHIERESNKKEFLERCAHVPRLMGIDRYKFYLARPA